MGNPVEKAQAKIEETVGAARDLKDSAVAKAEAYREDAVISVKEQPLKTLAIAAVIGFVIGAIWKS